MVTDRRNPICFCRILVKKIISETSVIFHNVSAIIKKKIEELLICMMS